MVFGRGGHKLDPKGKGGFGGFVKSEERGVVFIMRGQVKIVRSGQKTTPVSADLTGTSSFEHESNIWPRPELLVSFFTFSA